MLANDSKAKYPSFRIDDILNNDFRSTSSPSNDDQTSELNYDDKFDQPINLSSLSKNDLDTNQFKNLKSISSISSSSPLSVGSNSPSFHNQFSPTSKSPIDQIIKCNLNDSLQPPSHNSELNNLKPFTMSSSLCCSDEPNHHSFAQPPSFFNPCSPQSIEDFYLKLNKGHFENHTEKTAQVCDRLPVESNLTDNLNALKKIHQDYQAQHLANSALLDQMSFSQLQKDQFATNLSQNFASIGPSLNQPNPSFYMQQFYIRMKMLMNAKPRKGGQIRFNHTQTNELETLFNVKKYLIPSERKQIAKKLSLSERQVKTWFQNRRAKQRRSANYRT